MTKQEHRNDPNANDHGLRHTLADNVRSALWVLGIGVALVVIHTFANNPAIEAVIGALLVSVASGRAGLKMDADASLARRNAMVATSCTLGVVVLTLVLLLLMGGRVVWVVPSAAALFGVFEAGATAFRNEVWLHGLVIYLALRAGLPRPWAAAYATAAGVATVVLEPSAQFEGVVLALASGSFFSWLWIRTDDFWAPVAAHACWIWCCDSLLSGDFWDAYTPIGYLASGVRASGPLPYAGAVAFAALTVWLVRGHFPLHRQKPPAVTRI